MHSVLIVNLNIKNGMHMHFEVTLSTKFKHITYKLVSQTKS